MTAMVDLTALPWTLSGWVPHLWQLGRSMELGELQEAEIAPVPAPVPGSVQLALLNAGIIPDWNYGLNARQCEWVENRHWMYTVQLPDDDVIAAGSEIFCEGLDYSGRVLWDGKMLGEFCGSHRPHVFPLPSCEDVRKHTLSIVFDLPPRWLGQFGRTSCYSVGKPRFYYTWDWMPRIVQTGITGRVTLRQRPVAGLRIFEHWTEADPAASTGIVKLRGEVTGGTAEDRIVIALADGPRPLLRQSFTVREFNAGLTLKGFPVELWWPNGYGGQPLYQLEITLERDREVLDRRDFRTGFRRLRRLPCRNAPAEADPWVCECNGKPLFVQGVNWTPIRPNYADVTDDAYRVRMEKYRDLGINMFRIWGGASLEREILYRLCDEYGIMVWQEFPLCSSGVENLPPSDPATMAAIVADAEYYLDRLSPHVALSMWCGGNELQRGLDGEDAGCGLPCDTGETLLAQLAQLVERRDPSRRFVPSSASGPREFADENDYGKGLHWDVHGPWKAAGPLDNDWRRYWDNDDALFRSEVGSPGASPAAMIREFAGELNPFPCSPANPWWRYPLSWWNEHDTFVRESCHEPETLEEYVDWSQRRQAEMLYYIAAACKRRFPACAGIIIWMGHDSFPCAANTSILDFHGEYKPAALALRRVFREPLN